MTSPDRPAWFDAALVELMPSLIAFAVSKMRHTARAEDAVSRAIIKVLEAAPTYQDRGHFKAWVIRILYHEIVNQYRHDGRWRTNDPEAVDFAQTAITVPMPDAQDNARRVLEMVAGLPPQHRDAIYRVCVMGDSYDEAATNLETSINTVKSRLWRARNELQRRLTT